MVRMKVYIGKTDLKPCFGTKHHFHRALELRIGPHECPGHCLSKETIKTGSRIAKMRVYIRVYIKISKKIEKRQKKNEVFVFVDFYMIFEWF